MQFRAENRFALFLNCSIFPAAALLPLNDT
jgi:hypothetical protein